MKDCEKCIKGDGCKEGCSYWFIKDLLKEGFDFIDCSNDKIEYLRREK